jgi:peptidyl-prolyl cis-trans isomerase D
MPLMTKMREKLTLVFAIFAGLFIVYIVLDWGMDISGRKSAKMQKGEIIGVVNGENITYQQFNAQVERSVQMFKEQYKADPDEGQLSQIREEVWNMMLSEILMKQELEKMGLSVTDQEVRDWVNKLPETLPDMIRKNFVDSTGAVNRQYLQQAIQAQDPQVKEFWMQSETLLRQARLQAKMASIVLSTVRATEGEILQKYNDDNIKVNAKYVFFDPASYVKDNEVSVTDDEIKDYYEKHKNEFKQEDSRRLRVAIFPIQPSKQDSADVQNILKTVQEDMKKGIDFKSLVDMHSETKYSDSTYVKHGQIGSEELEKKVFDSKEGDIIGPVQDGNSIRMIKIINSREGKDDYIRVAHILLKFDDKNKDAKKAEAAALVARIRKGESILDLAKQLSQDPSVQQNGGDLGWQGKGFYAKEFEDAAFKAKVGEVVGPVETQFGFHVIKVLGKDSREVNLADIKLSITPSSDTKENTYNSARDFMNLAKDGDFNSASKVVPAIIQETQWFGKKGFIPGIGYNSAISKFSFNNKVGSVGDVYKIAQAYLVIQISDSKKEGFRDLTEVKDFLRTTLVFKKKIEKLKGYVAGLRNQIGNGEPIEKLSQLDPKAVVTSTGEFAIGGSITGIGKDGKVIGKLEKLQANSISGPLEGSRGIYVFNLITKTQFNESDYASKRNQILGQIMQEKQNQFYSEWIQSMIDNAKIEDNRDKYFR